MFWLGCATAEILKKMAVVYIQFNSIAQIQWVQCVDALGMHLAYYKFPVSLVCSGIVTLMPFWCIAWPAELTCSPPECFTTIAYPLFQAQCSGSCTAHAWMTWTRIFHGVFQTEISKLHVRIHVTQVQSPVALSHRVVCDCFCPSFHFLWDQIPV